MKRCPFCAEDIQDAAIVCRYCSADLVKGEPAARATTTVVVENKKVSPGVAAVLSLIIPGAGQMYCGRVGEGLFWLVLVVLGYAMLILPGLVLHVICIFGALSAANKINGGGSKTGTTTVAATAAREATTSATATSGFTFRQKAALVIMAIGIVAYAISQASNPKPNPIAPTRTTDTPTTGNPAHDRLAAMSELSRTTFFTKMFSGGDDPCGTVLRTFYQGSVKSTNAAMWNVGCSNGREYAITINNDATGSTRLLDCKILKAVAKTDCFKKY